MVYKFCAKLICFLLLAGISNAQTILNGDDPHIHCMGRVQLKDGKAQLQCSGTSAKSNFNSTSVKVLLNDEKGGNFFNVIVDDKVTKIILLDKSGRQYVLAENLPAGNHSVELFKRTEAENGKTCFNRFVLNTGAKLLAAPLTKKRRMEMYGNSITCGLAIADTVKGGNGDENNYLSYGGLTAKHFDEKYSCIARIGISIVVSWFAGIIADIYDRLDETDPNSKWDFSKYALDIVITDLGQNDLWIVKQPANEQYQAWFGATGATVDVIVNGYVGFINTIRSRYPKAKMIVGLGSMDASKEGSL